MLELTSGSSRQTHLADLVLVGTARRHVAPKPQHRATERQSVTSDSLKRRRKIVRVARLYWEYTTPSIDLRMSSIGIPALRVAILANSA
jgi:hypothetical protein